MDQQSSPEIPFRPSNACLRGGPRVRPAAVFSAGRLLLVSPHLDDAVLSCEAIIGGDPVADILNVFTAAPTEGPPSEWDQQCGFETPRAAMEARVREDIAAFHGTPHERHDLGLVETAYEAGNGRQAEALMLVEWVDDWLARMPGPSLVVLPAGAGAQPPPPGLARYALWSTAASWRRVRRIISPRRPIGARMHRDHVWVRDVLAQHLVGRGLPFLLYEEVPYLWAARGDAAVARLVRSLKAQANRCEFPIDRTAKARRVACHASQLPQLDPRLRPHDLAAMLPRTERYWYVTSTQSPLVS